MKALKYILISMATIVFTVACVKDGVEINDNELSLSGIGTRHSGGDNIYMKAFAVDVTAPFATNFSQVYIPEERVRLISGGGSTAPFPDDGNPLSIRYYYSGTHYFYPINSQHTFSDIAIYSYTGTLVNGTNDMRLTSGVSVNNDAVLSNYGVRSDGSGGTTASIEGDGTLGTRGSAHKPAKVLQYRHVMTKINVKVIPIQNTVPVIPGEEVGKIDVAEIDNIWLNLEMETASTGGPTPVKRGLASSGTYKITNITPPDPATANTTSIDLTDYNKYAQVTSSNYQLRYIKSGRAGIEGVNYVVPTGDDLKTMKLTSLQIDNYVATAADIADLSVVNSTYDHMYLLPGYEYDLNLIVDNLGVREIKLVLKSWNSYGITGDLSYEPYTVNLDLGNYVAGDSEDEAAPVTRMAVYRNGKLYIGMRKQEGGPMEFLTLPPADPTNSYRKVDSILLYTDRGLILKNDVSIDLSIDPVNEKNIDMVYTISAGGMLLANPSLPNSEANPYLVANVQQFTNIDLEPDGYYRQVSHFDLYNMLNYKFKGFKNEFTGKYDGNDYVIMNVFVEGSGLFDSVGVSGELKNVNTFGGIINASKKEYAGGLCGVNKGTIIGCINQADVENGEYVGGIVGHNTSTGKLIGCLNTGKVRREQRITEVDEHGNRLYPNTIAMGGLIGKNDNPKDAAIACISIGKIDKEVSLPIGGVCGESVDASVAGENVFDTCIWLNGSASENIGGKEIAIGVDNGISFKDCVSASDEALLGEVEILWNGVDKYIDRILTERVQLMNIKYEFKFTPKVPWPVFEINN